MEVGRNAFKSNFTDTKIDPFTIGIVPQWVVESYSDL